MADDGSYDVARAREAVRFLVRSEAGHIAYLDDELNALIDAVRRETRLVAEARLHALTRQLAELVDDLDCGSLAERLYFDSATCCGIAGELKELLARVDTRGTPERVVPQPSTGVQSTDQPVEEPFGIWQPIATAPKDGTRLLLARQQLLSGELIAVSGSWNSGGSMHMPHWMSAILGFQPSHWMPLPSPPTSAIGEASGSPVQEADL